MVYDCKHHDVVSAPGELLWPLTPKIDTATWAFFSLSDMRHGILKDSDMGHDHFLKIDRVTGAFLKFDRATLPFLKIDMRNRDPPPSRAPLLARSAH